MNIDRDFNRAIGVVLVALITMGISYFVIYRNSAKTETVREPVQIALAQVCRGQGVSEAATYDSESSGPHKIIILSADGKPHEWSNWWPDDLYPKNVNEVQLVACIGDDTETQIGEECKYQALGARSTVKRYQHTRSLQIREAKTGIILIDETITGSKPPECPQELDLGVTRIDGSLLNFEWFKGYTLPVVQGTTSP